MAAAGKRAVAAARLPVAPGTFAFDAISEDIHWLLEETRPGAVVLAFGISGTHTCASIPVQSRQLNVDRVIAISPKTRPVRSEVKTGMADSFRSR